MTTRSSLDGHEDSLAGFYSESGDLAVEGTAVGLRRLADALRLGRAEVVLDIEPGKGPSPYDGFLERIVIALGSERVAVSRAGRALCIVGNSDALAQMAANIDALSNERGGHLHEEYYPGHFYLAAESAPVVVELLPQAP